MGKYFDKTFFKFFFGFLAILFVSLAFLVLTRYFEERDSTMPDTNPNAVVVG